VAVFCSSLISSFPDVEWVFSDYNKTTTTITITTTTTTTTSTVAAAVSATATTTSCEAWLLTQHDNDTSEIN
jgi:hypothetical protein